MPSSVAIRVSVAMLLVAAGAGCRTRTAGVGPAAIAVTTEPARTKTLRDVIPAAGTIVPSTAADLTIYATEPAVIAELPKKEQDTVAVGDVLVRFDMAGRTQSLAALELDVLHASVQSDKANADFARQTALSNKGFTARNALDASRRDADTAGRVRAEAQARLDAAKAGPDESVVTAHFPATVLHVWHAVGDSVRPGTDDPIIRVIDPTRVQVAVEVPTSQLGRILPGQSATVTVIGTAAPAQPAVVARKPDRVDGTAPMSEIRLNFAQPATVALGTPVSAEMLIGERLGAVVVSTSAVGRDETGAYVLVAGDDQRAHRRDVRPGLVTDDVTQISAGLAVGERVIASGIADVPDGAPIVMIGP